MIRKIILLTVVFILLSNSISFAKERFDRGIVKSTFVPKGQWFLGGTFSYSEHTNDNYKLLILEDWAGRGYNLAIKPFFGYAVANDLAVGVSFTYKRTMLDIDEMNLNLSEDMSFTLKGFRNLEHTYTGTAFLRTYINLGESKRFGLYNDFKFMFGAGEGRMTNGSGETMTGTHQKIIEAGIILSPGVTVFINNFMAVEASVGVLGFQYKKVTQITNQVYEGSRQTSSANFKIDLLSIGLGIAFYF